MAGETPPESRLEGRRFCAEEPFGRSPILCKTTRSGGIFSRDGTCRRRRDSRGAYYGQVGIPASLIHTAQSIGTLTVPGLAKKKRASETLPVRAKRYLCFDAMRLKKKSRGLWPAKRHRIPSRPRSLERMASRRCACYSPR